MRKTEAQARLVTVCEPKLAETIKQHAQFPRYRNASDFIREAAKEKLRADGVKPDEAA